LGKFSKNIEHFTQKIVTKLSQIWVWDLGSEIRDPGSGKNPIPDPGSRVKKAPDPGSRIPDPGSWIPDPDPQHCVLLSIFIGYFFEQTKEAVHHCRGAALF
jgi:hypothetical protein